MLVRGRLTSASALTAYPAELRVLANAFNAMLERLEESFARLSRFSADIAHELRTPVNNIRGEAEVTLARARTPEEYIEVLGSCLEESVRLSELVESLLFLARSESPGDHLKRTPEHLDRLLTDLRDYYEATATEMGVTLTASAPDGIVANVDRALLQRALGNLVSNALAHCSSGNGIWLSAARRDEAAVGCAAAGGQLRRVAGHRFDRGTDGVGKLPRRREERLT